MSELWARLDLGVITVQSQYSFSTGQFASIDDQANSLQTISGQIYRITITTSAASGFFIGQIPTTPAGQTSYYQSISQELNNGGLQVYSPTFYQTFSITGKATPEPASYTLGNINQDIPPNRGLQNAPNEVGEKYSYINSNLDHLYLDLLVATGISETINVPTGVSAAQYISDFNAPLTPLPELKPYSNSLLANYEIYYPSYIWVDLGPAAPTAQLFTAGKDTVNFNNLTSDQQAAISNDADLYNGLAGDDTVTLPDRSHVAALGWDYQKKTFNAGPGNDTIIVPDNFGDIGVHEQLDGGAEPNGPSSTTKNVVELAGAPNDFYATLNFGLDLAHTHTAFQVTPEAQIKKDIKGYTIDTVNFTKVVFEHQLDNKVNLLDKSEAVEMLQLASEVYGPHKEKHLFEQLASLPDSIPAETVLVAKPAEDRGWHGVSSLELGMSPTDFGQDGPLHYALDNGLYQAYDDTDTFLNGDHPEANAFVLTGVVNGVKTLAIVFRGTDQWSDFSDYASFSTHYEKYAPLLQALNDYVADPSNGIAQVLVSGHSLGAAMAQIYMSHHQDSTSTIYRAWTDGSPGAEIGLPDDRIVNFVHTDDPVPKVPLVSDPALRPAIDSAFRLYLSAGGLPASTVDSVLNSVETVSPKHRTGTDVLLDSDVASLPLTTTPFAEHDSNLYVTDVIRLVDAAREATQNNDPLADTPIARALLDDDPVLAAGEPSNPYHANAIEIGVGAPGMEGMHPLLTDDFVLGSANSDDISIRFDLTQPPVIVYGGAGDDTLFYSCKNINTENAFKLVTNGAEKDLYFSLFAANILLARLFSVEHVQFGSPHVIKGYIAGATVFSDDNGNGQLDGSEISTTTDETGGFSLFSGTGPLIAFGGIDVSSGLPFKGQLSAPEGSSVVSPLTALLTALAANPNAQSKLLSSLGLSSTLDLTSFDPIAAAQAGSADGAATEVVGAKVYDTVALIASTLAAAGGSYAIASQSAFAAIAAAIGDTGIDLTNQADISVLVKTVAQAENVILSQGIADSVAAIIVASNAALDNKLHADGSGDTLLNDVAAIEKVIQGTAANSIEQAGNDSIQVQSLVSAFTGANLDAAVATALNHLGPTSDTTPPTLSPVADQTLEATSAAGSVAQFSTSAIDAVDGTDPVVFKEGNRVVHSGDTFALGSHTITASAIDAVGNLASEIFNITVADTTAPELTAVPDQTMHATSPAGATVVFGATASDLVDGSDAMIFKEGNNAVHSGDVFALGSHTIIATATDAAGNTASESFRINIADEAPILAHQTDAQLATAGKTFSFTLPTDTFQDPDVGDHFTLFASQSDGSALPAWLTFDPTTGTLKGTPGTANAGSFDVSIKATDPAGLSATDSFHFVVAPGITNYAPAITSDGGGDTASVIITDDTKFVDTVRATDPDPNAVVTYSIVGGTNQKLFTIDAKSGALSFKSEPAEGKTYQVKVATSDGTLQDTQTINVKVADGLFEFANKGVADTFVFKPHFGLEVVSGFDSSHDTIELEHSLFRGATAGEFWKPSACTPCRP